MMFDENFFITKIKIAGNEIEIPHGYVTNYIAYFTKQLGYDDVVSTSESTSSTSSTPEPEGDASTTMTAFVSASTTHGASTMDDGGYLENVWQRIDDQRVFDGPTKASCSDESDSIETLWMPVLARAVRINPIAWYRACRCDCIVPPTLHFFPFFSI